MSSVSLKIILLGNSGVGKTSLLSQYVTGTLSPDTMYTIGVEFKIKEIQVNICLLSMNIEHLEIET